MELWPREAPLACRNFVQLALEGTHGVHPIQPTHPLTHLTYPPTRSYTGYYDQTLFHRVIPGFMVQGGDPTGTGEGGESIYEGGKAFRDEIHSRLKFTHRGLLVRPLPPTHPIDHPPHHAKDFRLNSTHPPTHLLQAMANDNKPHTNRSQFFLTLDACEHLGGKHTIFGKVTGDTIFNVLRMGEVRPTHPPTHPFKP